MKMTQIYYKFVLFIISVLVHNSVQNCKLRFATDFPDKESILLWPTGSGYDLVQPEFDGVELKTNQQIALACPGRNEFAEISGNLVTTKCVKDQSLKIGNKTYTLNKLGCVTSVTGEFYPSVDSCGTTGIIKHIGYNTAGEFNILIDVCYDESLGGALYADHVIYGTSLEYTGSSSSRPTFKVGGVAAGVSPDIAYRQKTQETTFANILGSTKLAEKYIYSNSYLARGHLAPDADMIFVSSQLSTYFYINTVPQWQQINNGNWKSLETSVRTVASTLGENFQVYTGSHDVLTLKDVKGKQAKMYLANGKLPIPKFIWKVIHSYETNKGIAFVSVNNPFVEKATTDLYLCSDICNTYDWGTSSWSVLSKGIIYCCEIDDLRKTVANVPKLTVSGVQEANVKYFKSIYTLFRNHGL